jgi:hypothetical protein
MPAAVFGEAKPEKDAADALPRRPVLFHAHAHSQVPLRVVATDLRSLAWHCSLDLDGLQDLVRCVACLLLLLLSSIHPSMVAPDASLLLCVGFIHPRFKSKAR